jgi:hypothetical protein
MEDEGGSFTDETSQKVQKEKEREAEKVKVKWEADDLLGCVR